MRIRVRFSFFSTDNTLSFWLFVSLLVASYFYCDLHDYSAYYNLYRTGYTMLVEPGYMFLSDFFAGLEVEFYVFYRVLLTFILAVDYWFFMRYGKNKTLLFFAFAFVPYVNVLQQLRSATAMGLVLLGLPCLIERKKTYIFCGMVLLGSLFQVTTLFYLLLVVVVRLKISTLRRISYIAFLCGPFWIAGFRLAVLYLFSFFPYLNTKMLQYVNVVKFASKSALLDWVIFMVILLAYDMCVRKYCYLFSDTQMQLIKISYFIICATLLRGMGNNGYRLALMMYPILFVTLSNMLYEIKKCKHGICYYFLLIMLTIYPIFHFCLWWGPLFPEMYDIVCYEMWQVWSQYY